MMIFAGQFGTDLIHDFHPGIPPSCVFWTVAVPEDAVHVDLATGTASMILDSFPMPDFIAEAAGDREISVPGIVTLDMRWRTNGVRLSISDPSNEFDGSYEE